MPTTPSSPPASSARPREHRVSAAALVAGSRILLAHRSPAKEWYPDVWDVVGGHVEEGETAAAAMVREVEEELAVNPG